MFPTAVPHISAIVYPDVEPGSCKHLSFLTADANDPAMQELQHQARSSLQLPEDAPLSWNRLRDELACMEAEGQSPPVATQQQKLVRRIDYVTTKRRVRNGGTLPIGQGVLRPWLVRLVVGFDTWGNLPQACSPACF